MAGLVNEPVAVEVRSGQAPVAFTWHGKRHRIDEVLAWWREPSAWWRGEEMRVFLRVRAFHQHERIVELYRERGQWVLRAVLV